MNKRREISWVTEKIGEFEELYNNGTKLRRISG